MKTEEEARKCWCPFVRYIRHNGDKQLGPMNRWISPDDKQLHPDPANCIASECMAWRWASEKETEMQDYKRGDASKAYGYCGLAGRS